MVVLGGMMPEDDTYWESNLNKAFLAGKQL